MTVKRIFYSIGQGAFYSERHENLNIVYDCGSNTESAISNKVVANAFAKDDVIDILFISHFDSDHVNKISILKKHFKIKKVVLPLLHKEQRNFLTNIYRAMNIGNLTLINNPEKFFGKGTDIIFVKANENGDTKISIDELKNGDQISSGTRLYVKTIPNWVFIPYNHKYALRNNVLECKLHRKGFCINSLKNNPRYTLGEMEQDVKNSIQEIRKIYKSLKSKDGSDTCINENSMFLYSGVEKLEKQCSADINYTYGPYSFQHSRTPKMGCIYTGDGDLNVVDIKQIYGNFWEFVGTIQIPHHGAKQNFNQNVLTDKNYICPISAAKNNKKYNHPSSEVIAQIISHDSYPILISEDSNSKFVEEIII